jgi:hypothetical protein
MPLFVPCLADVGRARTELQKAFELGVLLPSSENSPAIVPDEASTGEMIWVQFF